MSDLRSAFGRPVAKGEKRDSRVSAEAAGYMELDGATKDDDCHKVKVEAGVSSKLGCCNEFKPQGKKVQQFRCGMCKFLRSFLKES